MVSFLPHESHCERANTIARPGGSRPTRTPTTLPAAGEIKTGASQAGTGQKTIARFKCDVSTSAKARYEALQIKSGPLSPGCPLGPREQRSYSRPLLVEGLRYT